VRFCVMVFPPEFSSSTVATNPSSTVATNPYVFRIWFLSLLRAFLRDGISLRVLVLHCGDEPVRLDQVCSSLVLLLPVGIFWVRLPWLRTRATPEFFSLFLFGFDFSRFGQDFEKVCSSWFPSVGLNFPMDHLMIRPVSDVFCLLKSILLIKRGPNAAFLSHLFLFAFLSACSCCVKVSWPEF
jgi:hypothetical protein